MSNESVTDERLASLVTAIKADCLHGSRVWNLADRIETILTEQSLRSKPVASGAVHMQNAVCQALLDAFPMADKIADNYAAVAVKALAALLPKATAPVVSEPVAKPYAFEFGKSNGDGTYCVVIERGDEGYVERFAVKDWPIKPLYVSPQPEAVITDEMVERMMSWVREDVLPAYDVTHNTRASDPEMVEGCRAALTAALEARNG